MIRIVKRVKASVLRAALDGLAAFNEAVNEQQGELPLEPGSPKSRRSASAPLRPARDPAHPKDPKNG